MGTKHNLRLCLGPENFEEKQIKGKMLRRIIKYFSCLVVDEKVERKN